MIELCIVMGIVSILFALVLGLARHVDATLKIRRAQVDLGEWHESLNRWFLQFGEYPHARILHDRQEIIYLLQSPNLNINGTTYTDARANLTLITNDTVNSGCYIRFAYSNPSTTNITFQSFLTTAVNTIDPWGTPYIYIPTENAKAYTLFSCGPNRKTHGIPQNTSATPDPALDDIHFER